MTNEDRDIINEMFRQFNEQFQHRLDLAVNALVAPLEENTKVQAESEARCKAADERTEARERIYDARNQRAEERAERQAKAWEAIAAALTRIAEQK